MPDEILKDVVKWLVYNFPAAIAVGLLVHLRYRFVRWTEKIESDCHWLKSKVRKLMERHATRHPDDALDLLREDDEE